VAALLSGCESEIILEQAALFKSFVFSRQSILGVTPFHVTITSMPLQAGQESAQCYSCFG